MPSKLYVGNLSFKVSESALSELFASLSIPVAGVKVIRDFETGKSRGFGFAELAPEADMAKAIRELNGKVVDGRALTVNEAKPQARRESGGFDRGRRGFGDRESRNNRERPRY
ncbi:MAG: RNA-binding protein [Acidobacteria bacterium]|nr:MAG: RNA-binding protein [Acidobacteriota bacterium]